VVVVKLTFNTPLTELRPATDSGLPFKAKSVDGTQWQISSRISGNETVKLVYQDVDGHLGDETFQIMVRPDEPPKLQIISPEEGKQLVATKDATADIAFTCTDDFGLGSVALYRCTASAENGELIQEWKEVAGQRTLTTNARIALGQFKAADDGRLSFVVVAKDQNDVTGPGVTISRRIVIATQGADQIQQQNETAGTRLQKSLEDLVKLQQTNLAESQALRRSAPAAVAALTPVLKPADGNRRYRPATVCQFRIHRRHVAGRAAGALPERVEGSGD